MSVEPIHINEQRLGVVRDFGAICDRAKSACPRAQVLDIQSEELFLVPASYALVSGAERRRGTPERNCHGVGFVGAKGRGHANVDKRPTSGRLVALGVAEHETGVIGDGADVDETCRAGLGCRAPPAVPVAPPIAEGRVNKKGVEVLCRV